MLLPLEGKGTKVSVNYRGINLAYIPDKVHGKVVMEGIVGCTEPLIIEEQCGFRKGREGVY